MMNEEQAKIVQKMLAKEDQGQGTYVEALERILEGRKLLKARYEDLEKNMNAATCTIYDLENAIRTMMKVSR